MGGTGLVYGRLGRGRGRTEGTPEHGTYGETLKMRVSECVVVVVVEGRGLGGGRTSTISEVPSVMTSVDAPNCSDVAWVAVLKMLLEKVRVKVKAE